MQKLIGSFAVLSLTIALPVPLGTQAALAQSNEKVCMTKKAKKRRHGKTIAVVVAKKSKIKKLKARGFKQTSCQASKAKRDDYKNQMCKFARIAPPEVLAQFESDHGASPKELCEASK